MSDKVYIHPHNNPEIEGSMAMYKEPKPEQNDDKFYSTSSHADFKLYDYSKAIKAHQQSLIGYIKEPEFKVGELVRYGDFEVQIVKLRGNGQALIYKYRYPSHKQIWVKLTELSHYYSGQQMDRDSFRWVEEKEVVDLQNMDYEPVTLEWQPVDEPRADTVRGNKTMRKVEYHEHIWKCFLMEKRSKTILGVITENDLTVTYQYLVWRKNKFTDWGTYTTLKKFFKYKKFISTLEYHEAAKHWKEWYF